jgi:hypothetical protein
MLASTTDAITNPYAFLISQTLTRSQSHGAKTVRASDDHLLVKRAKEWMEEAKSFNKSFKARSFDTLEDNSRKGDESSADDIQERRQRETNAGAAAAILMGMGIATPKHNAQRSRYPNDHQHHGGGSHRNAGQPELLPAVQRRFMGQDGAELRKGSDDTMQQQHRVGRKHDKSRDEEWYWSPSSGRNELRRDGSREKKDNRDSPMHRARDASHERRSRESSGERYAGVHDMRASSSSARKDGGERERRKMEREKDYGYPQHVHDERRLVDRRKGKVNMCVCVCVCVCVEVCIT